MSDNIDVEFSVIETSRLRLRPINTNDTQVVYEIFSDETLMIPYGMFPLKNQDAAIRFTERLISDKEIAICLKDEKTVIGTLGFVDYSKYNNRAEIAFELKEAYWNMGFMNEAISEFLKMASKVMGLNRIEACIHPDNIYSQKLVEKLGFEKEGLLKKRSIQRGEYKDLIIYGLIVNEVI